MKISLVTDIGQNVQIIRILLINLITKKRYHFIIQQMGMGGHRAGNIASE